MRTIALSAPTTADIHRQVEKVLRGLGDPEPPLRLEDVRDLLRLDRGYYASNDDGAIRETVSRMIVAGRQIIERPTLLFDAIRKFSLRALYIPDRKRILLDRSEPEIRQRWNEAHEIGHSLLPWHEDLMLGDTEHSLRPQCHDQMEAEANYAAGQLLFLRARFTTAANDAAPTIESVRRLKSDFGNSMTTTFWRYVENAHDGLPMIGLIGPHPRRSRPAGADPFRHIIESPMFRQRFEPVSPAVMSAIVESYCGRQRGGQLGASEVVLTDRNGDDHLFLFESFFNTFDCLTLAVHRGPHRRVVGF